MISGNPQGTLADVTVDSYQKNSNGSLVSDQYGTNYPAEVTFGIDPGSSEGWICSVTGIRTDYGRYQLWYRYTASISETDWSSLKANKY